MSRRRQQPAPVSAHQSSEAGARATTVAPGRRWQAAARLVRTTTTIAGLSLLLLIVCELIAESRRAAQPTLPEAFQATRLDPSWFVSPPAEDSWRAQLAEEIDATTSRRAYTIPLRWEPFSYWRSKPFEGRYVRVEADGRRRTLAVEDAAAKAARPVWMCGGSTMWGQGARDENTIPSALAQLLQAASHPLVVENHAQLGFVVMQQRIELERELARGRRPGAVVFLDGFNDCYAAVLTGKGGMSIAEEARRVEFNFTKRRPLELLRFSLSRLELARAVQPWLPHAGQAAADAPLRPLQEVVEETIDDYLQQLALLRALAKAFDFPVLCYWQPLVYFRQSPSEAERSLALPLPELKLFCQQARRALHSRDLPAELADLNTLFETPAWQGQTAFYDHCHLTERAQRAVAERIAADLLPAETTAADEPGTAN